MDKSEKIILGIIILLLLAVFACSCTSLGQKVATALKTSQENKTAIEGNNNKINNITQNQTKIVTDQKALQNSLANRIDKVEGDVKSSVKTTTNNPWPFVIIVIVILAWMYIDKKFPWFGRR